MSRRSHIFVIYQILAVNKPSYNIHKIRGGGVVQHQKTKNPHKVLKFVLVFLNFFKLEFGIYCDPFDVLLIIDM